MYNDVNNTEKKSDTNIPLLRWYKRRKNLFFFILHLVVCLRSSARGQFHFGIHMNIYICFVCDIIYLYFHCSRLRCGAQWAHIQRPKIARGRKCNATMPCHNPRSPTHYDVVIIIWMSYFLITSEINILARAKK